MTLPEALNQAAHAGRLLVLWGLPSFPLTEGPPANRLQAVSQWAAGAGESSPHSELVEGLPGLPPLPILSLAAGKRLERAFEGAGVPLQVVRGRTDVPAAGCHSLLKLAGDLPTRTGLVLSRAEIRDVRSQADKRHLLGEVGHIVAGGAVLLLDCDPASDDFCAWWAALAPTFRGAALFAVGEPSAPWPAGVACLGADFEAVSAGLRAVQPQPRRPAAPGERTLTWLHLSDLHFRRAERYNERIVLRALLHDVGARVEQDGLGPDFIIVSGDIAFGGKPAEYALAEAFFDELLAVTGLGKDRLFPVPGNHDVDRDCISRGAQGIAASLADRRSVNAVLADDADRGLLLARFEGYRQFVDGYLGDRLPCDYADGGSYYYVRPLDLAGLRVTLLGLNSAWLAHGGDEDRHKLALGERQVRAALDDAAGADLRIALMHHPFDWLRDFDRTNSEALLTDHCDFVLHGHMHQVGLLQARTPDSDAFVIAAGACYETREYPNSYNLVRLDLGAATGMVYLRRYSDARGGFWARDTLTYRNVPDGVYPFTLSGREARETGSRSMPAAQSRPWVTTPPPATAVDTGNYRLAVVRDLLLAAFTAEDLRRLFFYTPNAELRSVIQEFSSHDGLAAMVDKVISFCQSRALLPDLLREVRRANPKQYARHEKRLRGPDSR
jgi:3',5'-cyclic AMP phosphodiesterase CpdA